MVESAVNAGGGLAYIERFLPLQRLDLKKPDGLKLAIGDFSKVVVFCEGDANRVNLAGAVASSLQENSELTVAVCHYQQIVFYGSKLTELADDAPEFAQQLHRNWQEFASFPFGDLGDGAVVVVDEVHEIDKVRFEKAMEKIGQMPSGIRWVFIIPAWPNFRPPDQLVNLVRFEQCPCFGISISK